MQWLLPISVPLVMGSFFFYLSIFLCAFLLSWWLYLSLSPCEFLVLVNDYCWINDMRNMCRKVDGAKKDFLKVATVWPPHGPISQFSQFSHSVLSDSATPWKAAHQASLSITNSQSLLKLMSIESVVLSSYLILCRLLLLLPPIPPSIRVFSSESTFLMRWPKY